MKRKEEQTNMWNSATIRIFILSLFLTLASFVEATGQMTPEAQKFWMDYLKARDLNDDKESLRLVRRYKAQAVEVYDSMIIKVCGKHTEVDVERLKMLSGDLFKAFKDKRYTHHTDYILGLSEEDCEAHSKAWNDWYYGWLAYAEGEKNKNVYKLDEAVGLFKKSMEALQPLEDYDLLGEVAMRCAMAYELMEDKYFACVYFKVSMDYMNKLPYQRGENNRYVESRYNHYIGLGYDPTKPRDEGGEPPEATGEGGEGAEGEGGEAGPKFKMPEFKYGDNTINVAMKYSVMKKPGEFITPAYNTGNNIYLWARTWFDSYEAEAMAFNPMLSYYITFYGKQINVSRIKSKFFLDIEAKEKTRALIKATTKPTKLSLTGLDKGPDKKPYRYDIFLQTPGSQEVMFGIEMNNAVTDMKYLNLRTRTACYTKGKLNKDNIILIDDNCNGLFGDSYSVPSDTITYGEYTHWRPDAVVIGKEKKARPWSRYMRINDQFYAMEVDKFGREIRAMEVSVETGTLKVVYEGDVNPGYLVLRLLDDSNPGTFFDVADFKNPVVLPIGEYEIACGKIESGKKLAKQIRIYNGKAEYIKIFPNEETVLELGAPFTYTFETSYMGKNFTVKGATVNVWGKRGELYTQFFDVVPRPVLSIREEGTSKLLVKGEKMKMPALEDYQKIYGCQWHPLDFEFENKKKAKLEVQLETKSVKLLGGPIKSEWR